MRRNARRRKKKENWWNNKKILTGGSIAVVAFAFIIGVAAISNNSNNSANGNKVGTNQIISLVPEDENDTNTESASTQIGNSVEESAKAENNTTNETSNTTASNTKTKTNTTNSTKSNTNKNTQNVQTSSSQEAEVSFDWPVQGEILKAFSIDNLLYSSTLDEWVVHNGIDIKSDKTSVVKAVADGTVKSIKNDPRYGLTVVIEHNGSYKTNYSNLLTAEFVVEGEKVTKGQTIGTVGNTAVFEIADDSHLHFELIKDGEYVNPTNYLK